MVRAVEMRPERANYHANLGETITDRLVGTSNHAGLLAVRVMNFHVGMVPTHALDILQSMFLLL